MPKTKNLPTVPAKVSVVYVRPTFVSSSVCPHCDEVNSVEVSDYQVDKQILVSCSVCDKDYLIENSK